METDPKYASRQLDLITDTLNGLASVLRTTLVAKGQPPLAIISPASIAEQREQFRQQGKVQYPYCSMMVTGFNKIHGQTYNDALRRSGINVAHGTDKTYTNYRLIPILLTIAIKFYCQSFHEQLNFCNLWMHAEKLSQFFLKNESLQLNVQNLFSNDLSLAELNFADQGNIFTVETSLTSSTYIGEYDIRPKITKLAPQFQLANSNAPVATNVTDTETIKVLPITGVFTNE